METGISIECKKLLLEAQKYHWRYGDGLANHLPMALIALDKLNATPKQLKNLFNKSTKTLNLRILSSLKFGTDWLTHLGEIDYYETYLDYFKSQLDNKSIKHVLENHIDELTHGVASYAFHAMIYLAYAIESNIKSEVAHSLAFWCSSYHDYGEVTATTEQNLSAILESASPVVESREFKFGNITDRMTEVSQMENFKRLNTQPLEISLDAIAQVAIQAYNKTKNFTILHVVTGAQAMRVIMPYVQNKEYLLRYYWHTIVIAYLTTVKTRIAKKPSINNYTWQQVTNKATQSLNEHDIKIVYSCYQEYTRSNDDIYLKAISHLFNTLIPI